MIALYHVCKRYEDGTLALDDVNLTIEKGEFVFIKGPGGAGKTTLLKLLTCEEKVSSGQIQVLGKNLSYLKDSSMPYLRRNIGRVFQDFKLLGQKTVFENVALPLRIIGLSEGEIKKRVYEVLRSVSLEHRTAAYPSRLSGGEQQRTAIARALVIQPSILLADEPLSYLDEQWRWQVLTLFKGMNLRGATMVVTTNQQTPQGIKGRWITLEKGRIVGDEAVMRG